jgi:tRNA U54 and U55 pseudouridine synthase Pus10
MIGYVRRVSANSEFVSFGGKRATIDIDVEVVGPGWELVVEHVLPHDGIVPGKPVQMELDESGRMTVTPVTEESEAE